MDGMAKDPPAPRTITLTESELDAIKAEAAATAATAVQRGSTFIEGMTDAAEERVSKILGKPRDPRRPWPTLVATFSYEAPGWAGPMTGEVYFKKKDQDAEGYPLDTPIVTVTLLLNWKFPPLAAMMAKHGFDDKATFAPEGWGKRRPELKEGAYFSKEFLQYVIKNVYETPLLALFCGKDLKFIKPYLTSEPRAVDLGEIRRETGISGRVRAQ